LLSSGEFALGHLTSHMQIAIIGLGYVGLPLSLQFARSGVSVIGLDIDAAKVTAINQGQSYIQHIPAAEVAALVQAGSFTASTDFSRIREVEAVIICVPTPLSKNREPDISYITDTGESIASHLGHKSQITNPQLPSWWCSNPPPTPAPLTANSAPSSKPVPDSKPVATFTSPSPQNAKTPATLRAVSRTSPKSSAD